MTETIYASWVAPEPYWEGRSWFFEQWRRRHERYKNMLLCATGQSLGIGKSYWLLSCFEEIDPSFRIEQIVFNSEEFKKKDETPETILYKVYNAVKANPIRYSMKDRNGKLKLSALMVGSLIDPPCSDQTARRVITRIESEKPDLFSSQQSVR